MRKNAITLLLLCSFLFFSRPRYGGNLILYLPEPLNLNPYEASFSDLSLFSLMWTNLFERIDGKITSPIFESWEYNREKRTWKFTIKDGVLFSNATPITSVEIKKSIELYIRSEQPGSKSLAKIIMGGEQFFSGASNNVPGISAINPYELTITLKGDGPNFPELLSSPYIFLYTGAKNLYSGPYILSSWQKGESIHFKPNPYFPRGRVFLDGLKVVFKRNGQKIDFSNEGYKLPSMIEFTGRNKNVFIFFNPKILNKNTRTTLFYVLRENLPKSDLYEIANAYVDEKDLGFSLFLTSSTSKNVILPSLKLDIAVEKGLEPLSSVIEKILKRASVNAEFVFVPSSQIKKLFETEYFQVIIFITNPSPFHSIERQIIYLIQEYEIQKYDENFIAVKNLLRELENVNDENRKMELLFYTQKNMLESAVIFPLCRIRTKFYLNINFEGLMIDDYGRPVFWGVRKTSPL
ncbi:MAG: ABC transporter substrate-binding protein [Candidatus Aminicenantia bacterium]